MQNYGLELTCSCDEWINPSEGRVLEAFGKKPPTLGSPLSETGDKTGDIETASAEPGMLKLKVTRTAAVV